MAKHLPCPVCLSSVPVTVLEEKARWLGELGVRWLWHKPEELVRSAVNGRLQWACPYCLRLGQAAPGHPMKQLFCDHPPHLAYYDQHLTCQACGQPYVFTVGEQRFWYEERRLFVQARPKVCRPCRQRLREQKCLQQTLSEAVRTLNPRDPEQVAAVAVLFFETGNRTKGREYARRARNLALRSGDREELVRRLEELIRSHA